MKVDFEFVTEYGVFRDALHFVDGESLPGDDALEQMKQQRLQNWLDLLQTQAEPEAE